MHHMKKGEISCVNDVFCLVGEKTILNVYLLLNNSDPREVGRFYSNAKFSANVNGILHIAMLHRPLQ